MGEFIACVERQRVADHSLQPREAILVQPLGSSQVQYVPHRAQGQIDGLRLFCPESASPR